MMSLHQAQARSPDRTRRADEEAERHYQAVRTFAVEPFRLVYFHELELTVTPETHSLLCKMKRVQPLVGQLSASTVREYANGSLRYRLRCCRTNADTAFTESDWVTKETSWPDYIFPHFNGEKLVVRRGTHHGKDLPVELTDFVVPGVNKLKVATMQAGPTADKIVRSFHLAVEVVETLSHSAVLEQVWATGVVDSAETLEKIRKRIEAVPDEDGIAVIDRSGVTASELSIDLTDPFSARVFSIPARGSACTHMECFDLETWLNTRPIKQVVKMGQQYVCTSPKRLEPSEPDKWKCPICFGDARPRSLRIDSFMLSVRKKLEEQDKLETKSILVAADGTWRPVVEPIDEDDAGSDGDGPFSKGPVVNSRKRSSKSISAEGTAIEIIELD
jgi:zinc finger MIZ domain-containing protein